MHVSLAALISVGLEILEVHVSSVTLRSVGVDLYKCMCHVSPSEVSGFRSSGACVCLSPAFFAGF